MSNVSQSTPEELHDFALRVNMAAGSPHDVYHTVNLVTQCLCIPIVSLFVALRIYTRLRFRQALGVEDYACMVAWLLFMGYCAIGIVVGQYGGGYHITDLSDDQLVEFKKFCYIATLLYCPMALFVKIALLAILTRIFAPYQAKVWFIYIFLASLCCYYTAALIIKARICDPIPMYWLGPMPGGSCLDQAAALIADSVISVASDLIILVLPLPLTWSLQMSRNKKLRVIGLLGAGGLATAFSLYRLVLVVRDGNSPDQTIVFTCVILSGNAEGGVGLICACLPVLNVLLGYYRRTRSSQGYYHHSTDVQLQNKKSKSSTNNSRSAITEWGRGPVFGDQSHLISYAGAPSAGDSIYLDDGIKKTVAMSQTVESADKDSR